MIHHSAAKFVTNTYPKKGDYNNFSITKLLNDLDWTSIEKRREQAKLIMAYKIIKGLVILDPNILPKTQQQYPRQCNGVKVGFENQIEEPQARLDVNRSNFFYSTPKLWNNTLSPTQANAPSIDAFKSSLKKKLVST